MENSDVAALKNLAEREGIPYQTLLGSIVHKYVTGSLVDLNEAKKLFSLQERLAARFLVARYPGPIRKI